MSAPLSDQEVKVLRSLKLIRAICRREDHLGLAITKINTQAEKLIAELEARQEDTNVRVN